MENRLLDCRENSQANSVTHHTWKRGTWARQVRSAWIRAVALSALSYVPASVYHSHWLTKNSWDFLFQTFIKVVPSAWKRHCPCLQSKPPLHPGGASLLSERSVLLPRSTFPTSNNGNAFTCVPVRLPAQPGATRRKVCALLFSYHWFGTRLQKPILIKIVDWWIPSDSPVLDLCLGLQKTKYFLVDPFHFMLEEETSPSHIDEGNIKSLPA